jgi:Protein of unknown function (DUF1697)
MPKAPAKTAYILLFRGVGGAMQLPTAPLREALTGAGFENVATYISSGNAVLRSELPREEVVAKVAEICEGRFGFTKAIFAPTLDEWSAPLDLLEAVGPADDGTEGNDQDVVEAVLLGPIHAGVGQVGQIPGKTRFRLRHGGASWTPAGVQPNPYRVYTSRCVDPGLPAGAFPSGPLVAKHDTNSVGELPLTAWSYPTISGIRVGSGQ